VTSAAAPLPTAAPAILLLLVFFVFRVLRSSTRSRVAADAGEHLSEGLKTQSPQAATSLSLQTATSLSQLLTEHEAALTRMGAAQVAAGGVLDDGSGPYLLRFLLASGGDEAEATRRLVETTRWRHLEGAAEFRARVIAGSTLLDVHPAVRVMLSSLPSLIGHGSMEASPLNIISFTGFDPQALMARMSPSEYHAACIALIEFGAVHADRRSLRADRLLHMNTLLDFEGLHVGMISMRYIHSYCSKMLSVDYHYPELIGNVFVIHAPAIFAVLHRIALPLMGQELRSKISITSTDIEARAAAARLAPARCLPHFYGGECRRMPHEVAELTGWSEVHPAERAQLHAGKKLGGYL
jgi:hypothetical protein